MGIGEDEKTKEMLEIIKSYDIYKSKYFDIIRKINGSKWLNYYSISVVNFNNENTEFKLMIVGEIVRFEYSMEPRTSDKFECGRIKASIYDKVTEKFIFLFDIYFDLEEVCKTKRRDKRLCDIENEKLDYYFLNFFVAEVLKHKGFMK